MKTKFYTTLLLVFGISVFSNAQKTENPYQHVHKTPSGHIRCLSQEADAYSRALHPERGTLEEFERNIAPLIEEHKRRVAAGYRLPVLRIPVVVHVIHNGDAYGTGENIRDEQVLSQIQVLNEDFRRMLGTPGYNNSPVGADIEIEFCMATTNPTGGATNGINRVNYGTASFNSMGATDAMKAATIWDPTQYLNMWSVRFGGGMAGTLGYAQFPDNSGLPGLNASGGAANTDGVVSTFDAFGSANIYPAGTYNPTYNLGRTMTHEVGHWVGLRHIWGDGNCSVDDFCNDTPASDAANFGCATTHVSCSTVDMVQNYMDYSDDACMNIFTADQKARIRTVFTNSPRRRELPNSTKCGVPTPTIAFATDLTTINEGSDCGFQDVVLPLTISMAPSANATVTFNNTGSTASNGMDYTITPASVVFLAGQTVNKTVTVRIYNDAVVEASELIKIGFTVTTSGDAVATTTDLKDHDITIIDDDYAPTPSFMATVLNANFNTGADGFTSTGNAGSDRFVLGTAGTASSAFWQVSATNTTQFAYSNDDRCNCNKAADRLISPVFSLAGYSGTATLTFDHAFADAAAAEDARIEISTNGGTTYTNLRTLTNTSTALGGGNFSTPWKAETINLSAYLGMNNLRIRFTYNDGGGWNYGMAVDNVLITAGSSTAIQEAVNSANKDNNLVRANETAHWYDPLTGNVMGTIQNTSTWNYGCTTVEVDRSQASAGAAAVPFWDNNPANFVMAKSFYVSPTSNNASGTYNITFYFTEAEVAAWEAATGKPRSSMKMIKVANSPVSAVNATNYASYNIDIVPVTIGAFGSDVTLTASFSTGFSGLVVGDPAPVLLPMELLSFEAKPEEDNVLLTWKTASELNNDYFILQHSANGIDFTDIAEIDGAGTSSEINSYAFVDQNPMLGYNYYRLQQVNLDGSTSKSKVLVVEMEEEKQAVIEFAPNPVQNELNISYTAAQKGELTMEVFDAIGQSVVNARNILIEEGENQIRLNMANYPSGIYLVRFIQAKKAYTKRFIKE